MNRFKYYIVNIITTLRIIGIPFIFTIDNLVLQLLFADLLFITDFLDGFLARKYNVSSKFGAVLDLIADKMLVCFILIYGALFLNANMFLVILIVFREIYSIVLRYTHYQKSKQLIKASMAGKIKTTIQFISLNFVILQLPFTNIILLIVVIQSYYSFLGYFKTSRGKND